MSEFLGSRISLISKSDIRYVGTLHEINSDESTVSLENVRSYGTEGRRGRPEEEISPSDQVYEYIVFRGSDVKDLRIEEHPGIKENKPPPAMPDDPAIVGARTRDAAPPPQNAPRGGFQPQPPYPPNNFYGGPPPPGSWGRAGGPGPMPGPGFGNMPYPPPPGWFPPGQNFPPGGPGPWNNPPFPPGPGSLPGPDVPNQRQGPLPGPAQGPAQDSKNVRQGQEADRPKGPTQPVQPHPETEPKSLGQAARQPPNAPPPPVESKPSAAEVKAVASTLSTSVSTAAASDPSKTAPAGPRNNRITPVVPLSGTAAKPFQLPNAGKAAPTTVKTTVTGGQTSVEDATSAARAAVAVAMAQLGNSGGTAMDNLTNKVNEMRVNAAVRGTSVPRSRGRGGRHGGQKVEVPDSDFDFAQANAKFNKEDIAKEAIAGSPLTEQPSEPVTETTEAEPVDGNHPVAYSKSRSFFDNISSEAKDRAENGGQKPGGREWRGEEQRKNMETFGQGSVDGGYRSHRGRSRGRGRGYSRTGRGGGRAQNQSAVPDQQQPEGF